MGQRVLIQIPIVHTQADLGALAGPFKETFIRRLGEKRWRDNVELVNRLWTEIEAAIDRLALAQRKVRIYQDGLPVSGRELEIVTALAAAGSRNHLLLLRLKQRGATIMGTELADLLVEEYQLLKQQLGETPGAPAKARGDVRSRALQELLERRDRYIATRINSTLHRGEIGIIFLGLLHSVSGLLARDIELLNLFSDKVEERIGTRKPAGNLRIVNE